MSELEIQADRVLLREEKRDRVVMSVALSQRPGELSIATFPGEIGVTSQQVKALAVVLVGLAIKAKDRAARASAGHEARGAGHDDAG